MSKTRKQLYAELAALKEELPKREKIANLLYSEGFELAVEEYKESFTEAIKAEDKKEISARKKTLDLLIDFRAFLLSQQVRAEKIPSVINDIEEQLNQRSLFDE